MAPRQNEGIAPMTNETPARAAAEALARRLGFTSMVSRGRDSLDFKDVSIVALLDALETAYLAGYYAGQADADASVASP
jgi:hypothetical protein